MIDGPPLGTGRGELFQPGDIAGGQFEILREVGRGGMGVVYEAKNRLSGARVALKTILPRHLENPRTAERFIREITLVRSLNHPNIVAVFDVGQEQGALFFTMEYLDGTTLRHMLQGKGRLSLEQAAWVLRGIADALAYAHEKGIVHRDLSPENVMILRNGSLRLLDFGLARVINRPLMTAPGTAMGKAFYVAPEQRRDAASADTRADIYAMGVMFYEMLSGQLPTGYQQLRDLVPDLPDECDTLVEKTVAPLERRLESVASFVALLETCVAAKPRRVRWRQLRGIVRGHKRTLAACAMALLFVLAGAAVMVLTGRPGVPSTRAPSTPKPAVAQGKPMDALSYVWDSAKPDSAVTRLRFAPNPISGRLFELEGSGIKTGGTYRLEETTGTERGQILHLTVEAVSMLGGAMLELSEPFHVDARIRIEGDTMTFAMSNRWMTHLKPASDTLAIIPDVDSKQEVMERVKVISDAQEAVKKAGPYTAPASFAETGSVVVVLQRNARYADDPYVARMPERVQESLDQMTYVPGTKPLDIKWEAAAGTAVLHVGDSSIEFVSIAPGTFTMGSKNGNVQEGETPHKVTISKPFWLGKYEVTQAQWAAVMGTVPSQVAGSSLAVDAVSWEDADLFVRRLNRHAQGVRFRLPTEAEWEYAARAGTDTAYFFGTDKYELHHYAWCAFQKVDGVQPVGQLQPNPWGLYDIYGNVSEWCSDWFGLNYYEISPPVDPQGPSQGSERMLRGSTHKDDPGISTSYDRNWFPPNMRRDDIGLRLCAEKA